MASVKFPLMHGSIVVTIVLMHLGMTDDAALAQDDYVAVDFEMTTEFKVRAKETDSGNQSVSGNVDYLKCGNGYNINFVSKKVIDGTVEETKIHNSDGSYVFQSVVGFYVSTKEFGYVFFEHDLRGVRLYVKDSAVDDLRLACTATTSAKHTDISRNKEATRVGPLTKDLITEVQRSLGRLGFDPGPADGILGKKTKKAISAYQRSVGLDASGEVDGPTLKKLDLNNEPTGSD